MVFFSCKGYDYTGKHGGYQGLETAIGLNVLSVVVVNEDLKKVRDKSEFGCVGEEFYGVDERRQVLELDTVTDEIL
jgi:hypothetical protein